VEAGLDPRPLAGRGVDGQRPVRQLGTLAHAWQPEPGGLNRRIEPAAVVADRHVDRVLVLEDLDNRAAGLAVLGRVRQRLLNDPVDRCLELQGIAVVGGGAPRRDLDADIDRQALGGELLGQRVDRRFGAELFDVRGPQVGDEPAQVGDV
jgi:hypothetical protein